MHDTHDTHALAARSPLGKAVAYRDTYSPELLFQIPRVGKRRELGLRDEDALPFVGHDLWNAHELSWLDPRGKPVVATATLVVPADSPCMVESKSLKLYLNAFNQSRFASAAEVAEVLGRDLGAVCGSHVQVSVTALCDRPKRRIAYPRGVLLDRLEIDIDRYQPPSPEFLAVRKGRLVSETLYSHLLKSNCLVTGQPDWGMLVVRYSGRPIDRAGLLRYIVSFRGHDEFHEQCVERIYCDIRRRCAPDRLSVWARYTRRGGLDINPFRSSEPGFDPGNVMEIRQ